jgi:predicted permease
MRWLSQLTHRIATLFRRGDTAARLQQEMAYHLERAIAENIAAGMSPDEARYAALRTFGNPALLREQTRVTWGWSGLEAVLRDLRYSVRTLVRTPGFALIAILVMALGIGANVALFTIVRGVLLRPLPFRDPGKLLMIYESGKSDDETTDHNVVAGGMYAEWAKHNHTLESMAITQDGEFVLSGSGSQLPENLPGAECSWNLFSTLGVYPLIGRDFTAADDKHGATATAILSWNLYKRRFGANPAILNQTIYIDALPYTVVGVMPAWFEYPGPATQLWTPVYRRKPPTFIDSYEIHAFGVVGRLKRGVSEAQARADLTVISRQIQSAHSDHSFIMHNANTRPLMEHMVGDLKRPLYVLMAATACVLLIACLNVANLLVARASSRKRELAIRTALGGGWLRLMRERLMESLLLSTAGGALGLIIASGAVQWLLGSRQGLARAESIHIDGAVSAFTIAVVVVCALFAGLISAFSTGDRHVLAALHESSRAQSGSKARTALRRTLLTIEVALTVVLLIGAGLLLKSYERMRSTDMGCVMDNVLTMHIMLPGARYNSPAKVESIWRQMLTQIRAVPGVTAAAMSEALPGQGWYEDSGFTIIEHPPLPQGSAPDALNRWIDPDYFSAMGIPILRGRTLDPSLRIDRANEIVISRSFARKFFPDEDAIGKHLGTDGRTLQIVGIVGDTLYAIGEEAMPTKYFSVYSGEQNSGMLVIRSNQDVETLALPVQRVIQSVDHDLPVANVLTMQQLLGKSMLDQSFNTTLLVGFASLSLLLAAVGLFGVLSYIVAQRTGEIGIRMALGAPRAQVMRRILFDGMRPAIIGLVLGLLASIEASRLLRDMLYETRNLDPIVFAAVAATLLIVAAVACLMPAWRASRIDPMQALRSE